MPVQTQLQIRRDTGANWSSTNPTLASGEWGLETDTRLMKIGDGATAWNSLGYQLNSLLDEELATDPNGAYFTGSGFKMYGVASNYADTPDSSALDITGDIDIRVKVAMDDWTPAAITTLVAKYAGAGSRSYLFSLLTDGTLRLQVSSDGTATVQASSNATGISDGATKWVRATLDVDNGSSQRVTSFYLSDDGTNWTQLGTSVTQAGTTSIFNSTAVLRIGHLSGAGTEIASGTFYRAQVLNGIAGTVAFDANFETVPADSFAFTESSANAATVTLTTTRYSFGIPSSTFGGTGTFQFSSNTTYYVPFRIFAKPITIKHYAFETTVAPTVTSSLRFGIYKADANGQPTGTIIYSGDAISVSTTAAVYRVRVNPFILLPGNYVIAFNISNQATLRLAVGGLFTVIFNNLGANLVRFYSIAANLSGNALPNTGTLWTGRTAQNASVGFAVLLGWS